MVPAVVVPLGLTALEGNPDSWEGSDKLNVVPCLTTLETRPDLLFAVLLDMIGSQIVIAMNSRLLWSALFLTQRLLY